MPLRLALQRRHRHKPFDVVQAASCRACGLATALRKFVPVVSRVSSYQPLWREAYGIPATRDRLQRENAELMQLRRSTLVYSPSALVADILRSRHELNVRLVEPPFDINRLDKRRYPPVKGLSRNSYGLFFGGLGTMKGCDRLVSVLPEFLRTYSQCHFVFIGKSRVHADGEPYDRVIRSALSEFGSRVVILTPLPQDELFRFVRNAKFIVLPSRIDNLPNACLESMALERVVVATRGASFEQVITHEWNGFLASQDDDQHLLQQLKRAWELPERESNRIGQVARQSLRRLGPQNTITTLVRTYVDSIDVFRGSKCREAKC